ncbi:spore germination protein [Bacillus salitolerans]|uniref:Spore germination protein n=1 Tax=Bacillus salitolerans TaxID=1437434 RepID=A0ABW4LY17_9BACI
MRKEESKSVTIQELKLKDIKVTLTYIKTIINSDKIQTLLVKPFFELKDISDYRSYLKSLMGIKTVSSEEEKDLQLAKGDVAIQLCGEIYLLPVQQTRVDSVNEATVETTIQGPRFAFTENLIANLNILRSRYQNPHLTVEVQTLGEMSNMDAAVIYDKTVVNSAVLDIVMKKLEEIDEPIVETTEKLQNIFTDGRRTLFPVSITTERPDRVVYNIAQGKVVIFINGSPFALIAPAVFWDFLTSMDDLYQTYWVSQFFRSLRFLGLLIGLVLPALYVGIVSYNPELLRSQLAISITASRQGVPYPSFIEVLFMLIMMELLVEASIRLPKAISSTATTVGGLILGQAATEASLVSNIMIIIVAAVAISNFSIPLNQMSYAIRIIKYVLLIFGTLYGLIGLAVGLVTLTFYLTSISSYGEPYFKIPIQRKPNELKGVTFQNGE